MTLLLKRRKSMKKLSKIIFIFILLLSISGCFKRDSLEGITIYTTVYPIEYITNRLYKERSDIYVFILMVSLLIIII